MIDERERAKMSAVRLCGERVITRLESDRHGGSPTSPDAIPGI
jgi:hypothetical protein